MKTIIAILLSTCFCFGQVNEQRAIKETHIDFNKESVYFVIHGMVEVDGHTFYNDTSSNPFVFLANLDGIKIFRKNELNETYNHRICKVKGCRIIHLVLASLQNMYVAPDDNKLWLRLDANDLDVQH